MIIAVKRFTFQNQHLTRKPRVEWQEIQDFMHPLKMRNNVEIEDIEVNNSQNNVQLDSIEK